MPNFVGHLEKLFSRNEAKFIRQNHLNYSCRLLGSVSNNSIGEQKYVPLWTNLKDNALFFCRMGKENVRVVKIQGQRAERKSNIPRQKWTLCLWTRTLGSGLISLAEERVIEMERVHIIKMKDWTILRLPRRRLTCKNGIKIMNNLKRVDSIQNPIPVRQRE